MQIVAAPSPYVTTHAARCELPALTQLASDSPSYSLPPARTDQTIRESLFASATVATFLWLRRSRSSSHSPILWRVRLPFSRKLRARWKKRRRRWVFPRFVIPPSLVLPPVDICRVTRPSQAAKSRPRQTPIHRRLLRSLLSGPVAQRLALSSAAGRPHPLGRDVQGYASVLSRHIRLRAIPPTGLRSDCAWRATTGCLPPGGTARTPGTRHSPCAK